MRQIYFREGGKKMRQIDRECLIDELEVLNECLEVIDWHCKEMLKEAKTAEAEVVDSIKNELDEHSYSRKEVEKERDRIQELLDLGVHLISIEERDERR